MDHLGWVVPLLVLQVVPPVVPVVVPLLVLMVVPQVVHLVLPLVPPVDDSRGNPRIGVGR